MTPRDAYRELLDRSKEAAILGSCSSLLGWDEQTYLPKGGIEHRGEQMALLAGLKHEKSTSPRIADRLAACEGTELTTDPLSVQAVNLREIRRVYDRTICLPRALVEALAKTTSLAQQEWIEARKEDSFTRFQPWLEKILSLKRDEADAIGGHENRYDVLLEDYEPGTSSEVIAGLFDDLKKELVPLVQSIAGSARRPKTELLSRTYPIPAQRAFGEQAAATIGFDFHRGRLDTTTHPFCSGVGPGDTRLTCRFSENDFCEGLFGILHEAGHGIYDQGLDPAHYGAPMGEAVSLGVHESQSRLWENLVGRSLPFWRHFFPLAKKEFNALADVSLDDFYGAINSVQPSLIRVEADEVTYNLHVLIRFELEQALIAGHLTAADVPDAWNDKYETNLGIKPPSNALGCLQDIHWSAGLIGYFPTYTLGNLYAAQIFDRAKSDIAGLETEFASGRFDSLLQWLRQSVHRHGQRFRSGDLVERITGDRPNHRSLISHLKKKAAEIYGV